MLVLQFPDNQRIVADNLLSYSTSSNVLNLVVLTGTTVSVTLGTAAAVDAIVAQMERAISSGISGVVQLGVCIITGCNPTTFVATGGAGPVLDIYGQGFYPAMANGLIHVEDIAGGFDGNGFTYTITYIDSGHIQATWQANGDGTTGASLLYFVDANGSQSNGLYGLTTS